MIRQYTKSGDPMIRVHLPASIIRALEAGAKQHKRPRQDQFIKMIAKTFNNEAAFIPIFEKLLPEIKAVY